MGVLGALGWLTAVVACSLLLDSASAAAAVTTAKPKMATHQAFLNAGKTAGLEIWRIEVRFKLNNALLIFENNMLPIVNGKSVVNYANFNCRRERGSNW
jgi:hypothetical protein